MTNATLAEAALPYGTLRERLRSVTTPTTTLGDATRTRFLSVVVGAASRREGQYK
jgi:hypothetical protein